MKFSIPHLDSTIFEFELYECNWLDIFKDESEIVDGAIGYCKASELKIRPRTEGYAVMFEVYHESRFDENDGHFVKAWCHFYDEEKFERLFGIK